MEAFGLLNLIKSALALSEEQAPDVHETAAPDTAAQKTAAEPTKDVQEEHAGDAFAAFVEKHERMAKKFRK